MKKAALFSAIVIALSVSGLSGCDNTKTDDETTPSVSAQADKPEPTSSDKVNPQTASGSEPTPEPVSDEKQVVDAKMGVYITCFNNLQLPVSRSISRYASWLKDFKKGPTGKEKIIYGIYGIIQNHITQCESEMKYVIALSPKLEPIDDIAVKYIDTAAALSNTINEMDDYYSQENYKDDNFAKGKDFHQQLLVELSAFEPVAEQYHVAILEINDRRQSEQLSRIEASEGKTFNYYALATMIIARQINTVIAQSSFDAQAMVSKVAELEATVKLLKQADKNNQHFSFVNAAGDFQLAAKKYIRRVKNNVDFSADEKEELQDPMIAWMVEDSYPAALKHYNEMVADYNLLR